VNFVKFPYSISSGNFQIWTAYRHAFTDSRAFTDSVCFQMRFADWRVAVERALINEWLVVPWKTSSNGSCCTRTKF
jgi:hypothetical protein